MNAEEKEPPIQVENVEQVNVTQTQPEHNLPYAWVLFSVSAFVLVAFGLVTYSALVGRGVEGVDDATRGSLIQTWNNVFIAVVSFWLGSSVGGKGKK